MPQVCYPGRSVDLQRPIVTLDVLTDLPVKMVEPLAQHKLGSKTLESIVFNSLSFYEVMYCALIEILVRVGAGHVGSSEDAACVNIRTP
jgi:hypothetical protein